MNAATLQRLIDEFHDTSAQQWALRFVAVLAALGAVLAANAATQRLWPAGLFIVTVLALASAFRPDEHTGLVVIAIVVWHWLATVDDLGTVWLPVAAVSLLVFHSVIAVSASVPIGGTIPRGTLARWASMIALTGLATMTVWMFVVLFDRRDAAGNALLTALSLALVAGAAVIIRSRSLDTRRA